MERDTNRNMEAKLQEMNGEFRIKTMKNINTNIKMTLKGKMKKNRELYLKLKPRTKA